MSRRLFLPRLGAALGAALIFSIGYLAGACFRFGFLWIADEKVFPGIAATLAGFACSMFAVVLAAEIGTAYRRAVADRKPLVLRRPVCKMCASEMDRPYIYDHRLKGFLCMNCGRLMERGQAL